MPRRAGRRSGEVHQRSGDQRGGRVAPTGMLRRTRQRQGQMQADLNIYRLQDELILDFEPGLLEPPARLESNLVADQADLDASPHFGLLSLQGPKTTDALESVGLKLPDELFAHTQVTQDKLGDWYPMRNDRLGRGASCTSPPRICPGQPSAWQGRGRAGWWTGRLGGDRNCPIESASLVWQRHDGRTLSA